MPAVESLQFSGSVASDQIFWIGHTRPLLLGVAVN
jgi:hypothetical protein